MSAFKLTWDELPDDFKDEKITEYMENLIAEGEEISIENPKDREEAEHTVAAYFPISF